MCVVQLILKESPGKLQNHKTNIYKKNRISGSFLNFTGIVEGVIWN